MDYKYGKLPARRLYGVDYAPTYVAGKLPPVPAHYMQAPSIPQAKWGMFLNDTYGDCAVAGAEHLQMAWNTEVSENDPIWSDAATKATYFGLTGGSDSGLVLADLLHSWQTNARWFGNTLDAYVPLDHTKLESVLQAVYFWGGAYLGIAVPQSMQMQFQQGLPITYVPGSGIEGGHCIIAVGYDQQYVYIVTWGRLVPCSYHFLANYLDEVWAAIPNQYVEAKRGPTMDLATLRADLKIAVS